MFVQKVLNGDRKYHKERNARILFLTLILIQIKTVEKHFLACEVPAKQFPSFMLAKRMVKSEINADFNPIIVTLPRSTFKRFTPF